MRRARAKKTTLTGREITPFDESTLQKTYQKIQELPQVGEPLKRYQRRNRQGQELDQAKEYLVPGIISLFQRGYSKDFVIQTLAEQLQVGKTNVYLLEIVREASNRYFRGEP